jgi:predicted SPOUT superfamily RNA methylase MTH1
MAEPVGKRRMYLTVAFPSSVLYSIRNDLVATLRLAEIARAAAIFRVDELLVYLERDKPADRSLQRFASLILDYLATPQYIRKRAFALSRDLRYAGALPPLRTPNQLVPASEAQVSVGDIREGFVTKASPKPSVDIGLKSEFSLDSPPESVKAGTRGFFRVVNKGAKRVQRADWDDLEDYWRYTVSAPASTLGGLLKSHDDWLKIGTSRYGEPVSGILSLLQKLVPERKKAIVFFGSPSRGLSEISAEEKINVRATFDLTLNTAINQGVATVRTEEAILISLSVLNEILD